jgi:hypothetical protein
MTTALKGGEGSASRPGRSLPPGKTRYPLYRRLGGPDGRSGQLRKMSPLSGFDSRTVQPVASRYTDYPTRPTNQIHTVYIIPPYFIKVLFNIFLPSTPRYSKWSISFVFPYRNSVCISFFLAWFPHDPPSPYSFVYHENTVRLGVQIIWFLLLQPPPLLPLGYTKATLLSTLLPNTLGLFFCFK